MYKCRWHMLSPCCTLRFFVHIQRSIERYNVQQNSNPKDPEKDTKTAPKKGTIKGSKKVSDQVKRLLLFAFSVVVFLLNWLWKGRPKWWWGWRRCQHAREKCKKKILAKRYDKVNNMYIHIFIFGKQVTMKLSPLIKILLLMSISRWVMRKGRRMEMSWK